MSHVIHHPRVVRISGRAAWLLYQAALRDLRRHEHAGTSTTSVGYLHAWWAKEEIETAMADAYEREQRVIDAALSPWARFRNWWSGAAYTVALLVIILLACLTWHR